MKIMTRLRLLVAVLLLPGALFAAGQKTPDPAHTALMANVLNRNGSPVRDLTKENFRVKVNGRPAVLLGVSYDLAPRRMVVLLDMSESMAGREGDNRRRIAREAVDDVLADTPSNVSVALLTFSDHVRDVFDFSQSRSSMAAWLKEDARQQNDSRIHERTALFDAVLSAIKMLGTTRPGDAIYLISDAGDNSSHVRELEVRKLLLQSQVRLFAFLLNEQTPLSELSRGTDAVKEIARATGGFVFGVSGHRVIEFLPTWSSAFDYNDRTRDLIKTYTQALNFQVNGFYRLQFDLPVTADKAKKISLEVVDRTGKPRNDVAYTYSTALLPETR